MAKIKTAFFCRNCGAEHTKWLGKCSACHSWNTLVEEIIQKSIEKKQWKNAPNKKQNITAIPISQIQTTQEQRIVSASNELNRVLGGGIVSGSLILLGGDPGIGKSTLTLQLALSMKNTKILYVSGEESMNQIKMRADRICKNANHCYILTETHTENIFIQIKNIQPQLLIIDSIQTMQSAYIESSPGSISQIKECTAEFLRYTKETGIPVLLIGHITKDGHLAGPKVLEHMVDVVLQFEGDRNHIYRILRAHKNRFGSIDELGIYQMQSIGLKEVTNPSKMLISKKDENLSGSSIAATLEGMRPIMIEVQALVSTAVYGTPQRSCIGYDLKRLNMILAVLEKRAGFKLAVKDVFLNITGGIKVDDPAIDLAVVTAILSSNSDIAISNKYCFAAEVGLSGEIRNINKVEQRISEAQKLGFKTVFVSKYSDINPSNYHIQIILVSKVENIVQYLFH